MVATLPGRTQGLGLVTEPLMADLAIDRVSFASINLWATLIGALFCLPCGRLVDRHGSRIVLTAVLVALSITVLAMSACSRLVVLCLAITLTRGLGQSALSVVSLALVGKWFGRRLHHAMGIYSLLLGIGFVAAFPGVGQAVVHFGWRAAWAGVGLATLVVVAPIAWAFTRNDPPDRSLEFGGDPASREPTRADLSLPDALRSSAFWLFAASSSLFGLVHSGISLFNQSILEERGFDASDYHTILAISTAFGLAANFGAGWLSMRWPIQRLMGLGMAALSLSLAALPRISTFPQLVLYGILMGIAGGVVMVAFFSVWGKAYGRSHLGRIQGAAQMMTVLASALGPLLLAETIERTGSYDLMFYALGGLVLMLGIASWRVPMPARPAVLLEAASAS